MSGHLDNKANLDMLKQKVKHLQINEKPDYKPFVINALQQLQEQATVNSTCVNPDDDFMEQCLRVAATCINEYNYNTNHERARFLI